MCIQLLVVSVIGCSAKKEGEMLADSGAGPEQRLSADNARAALIQMIEREYKDDYLLQGALPFLRTKKTKEAGNGVIEIGAWTCYLRERRFEGRYVSTEQRIFAEFAGKFVLDSKGHWQAVITKQTRND
ncbi:MAG: hypothetical protein ABFC96_07310 [Thermoguttaceae bacterium]